LKDTICGHHATIMRKCEEIKYAYLENLDSDDINQLIEDIYEEARLALIDGQKLEDRLKEYRSAIESLGFERVKSENK
jgi:hypothetical protein